MRVRTIRTHMHGGIAYDGSAGAIYDVDEATARNLIHSGYVEDADAPAEEPEPKSVERKRGKTTRR